MIAGLVDCLPAAVPSGASYGAAPGPAHRAGPGRTRRAPPSRRGWRPGSAATRSSPASPPSCRPRWSCWPTMSSPLPPWPRGSPPRSGRIRTRSWPPGSARSAAPCTAAPRCGAELMLASAREPSDAARVVGELLRRGERIPGFGHFVYKTGDPRSVLLLSMIRKLAPDSPRLAVADAVLAEVAPPGAARAEHRFRARRAGRRGRPDHRRRGGAVRGRPERRLAGARAGGVRAQAADPAARHLHRAAAAAVLSWPRAERARPVSGMAGICGCIVPAAGAPGEGR